MLTWRFKVPALFGLYVVVGNMDLHDSPLVRYEKDLLQPGFSRDPAQAMAVEHLQSFYERLLAAHNKVEPRSLVASVKSLFVKPKNEPVKGLYMWGGVGRGKTYLMDVFYDALPFEQKMRTHFHRFMRRVHAELTKNKGKQDPLKLVADTIASEAKVICFDEFFVVDITDAMILGNLLQELFARGVSLVATSNIETDGLYKDGLQRVRFLPAIEQLKKYVEVVNVDGGVDYRLRALEQAALYYTPLSDSADEQMSACFERLVPDPLSVRRDVHIEVGGRKIRAKCAADDVAWFDFDAICDGPRSQNDYIDLACEHHAVLVSGVPELGARNDDKARRFIYLVDEFYDRNVKLILSAELPIEKLYGAGRLEFEFQRTVSRVLEMQSHEYLSRAHKA